MPCSLFDTLVTETDSWKTGPLSSSLAVLFEVTKSSKAELNLFVGLVLISGSHSYLICLILFVQLNGWQLGNSPE